MATKKTPETIEAFVLLDCTFGAAGDVVTLPTIDAETGAKYGMLDLHPEAVKAAKERK